MIRQFECPRRSQSESPTTDVHRKPLSPVVANRIPGAPAARHTTRRLGKVVILALALLGLMAVVGTAPAQQVTTLLEFTNVWKYNQSGLDPGTAWAASDFNDADWPSGPGLLGFDNTVPFPYHLPIETPLTISSTVTTYYFRATFEFAGDVEGLSLIACALADDGCAIYLNGQRVGGVRAPESFNAATYFPGHPGTVREDIIETVAFTNLSALVQGQNVLAAEVHQSSATSSDTVWGMKLLAIQPSQLVITRDLQSQNFTLADPFILDVEVSGGPAFYQWQKNGQNLLGATSSTLNLGPAQGSHAGDYRVLVTNNLSSLVSATATVAVLPDITGPRLLSAIVRGISPSNQIILEFTENLQSAFMPNSPSTNLLNYIVTSCESGDVVTVSNVIASGRFARLTVGGPNWTIGGCYSVTINNISDTRGNRIAPGTQAAVAWLVEVDIANANAQWSIHTAASQNPVVFSQNWTSADYVETAAWLPGTGFSYYSPLPPSSTCLGVSERAIGYQPEPSLFRTTFDWPASLAPTATLTPNVAFDDGIVLYLNGIEIWRSNVPASETKLSAISRASSAVASYTCISDQSITVTNLRAGLNCLAAAIVQAPTGNCDTIFALTITAAGLATIPLPDLPAPSLIASPEGTNALHLSWNGGGYALESTTNLTDNSASYPNGPWQEVPNMSNPYTNTLADPARFFRLKK